MAILTIILIWYGIITLIIDVAFLLKCNNLKEALDDGLNPISVYKSYKVNVFGCIMLTIAAYLIVPWVAPFFWLYKLCTVGRR